jgi:hypothetical protein
MTHGYRVKQDMHPGTSERLFTAGPKGIVWLAFRQPRRGDRPELGISVWSKVVSQAQAWAFCSQGPDETCLH